MARRRKRLTKSEALQGSQALSQSLMHLGMYQEREKAAKETREEREQSKASQVRQRDQDYALGKERLALDREKFEADEAREQAKLGKVEDTKIRAYEELARDYQEAVKEAEANEGYEVLSSEQERVFAKKLQGLTAGNEALLSGLGQDGRITSPEMVPLVLQALRHTEDKIRAELPPDTSERTENLLLGSTRTLRRQLEEIDGGLRSIAMQRARGPRFGGFSGQEPLPEPDYAAMEKALLARGPAIKFIPWNGGESGTVPDFLSYAKVKRPGLTSEDLMRDMADSRVQNIFGRVAPGATVADFRDLDVYQNETPFAAERLTQAFGPQEAPDQAGAMLTGDEFEEDEESLGSQMFERAGPMGVLERGMRPEPNTASSLGTKAFGRQGPLHLFDELEGVAAQGPVAGPQRSRAPMADAYSRNVLSPIQQFMQERQPAMNAGPTPGLGGMGGHDARGALLQLPLHLAGGAMAAGEMMRQPVGDALSQFLGPMSSAMSGGAPQPSQISPMSMTLPSAVAANRGMMGSPEMIGARQGPMRTPMSGQPPPHPGPMEHAPPPHSEIMGSDPVFADSFFRSLIPNQGPGPMSPVPSSQALHDELRQPRGTAAQALLRAATMRAMSEPMGSVDQAGFLQALLGGMGGY